MIFGAVIRGDDICEWVDCNSLTHHSYMELKRERAKGTALYLFRIYYCKRLVNSEGESSTARCVLGEYSNFELAEAEYEDMYERKVKEWAEG